MTIDQLLLAIPGIGALILSIFQQVSLNKQNKRTADLDAEKLKFEQNNSLMGQQRELINTLQGLLTERDATIRGMQTNIDTMNQRLDSFIQKNASTEVERKLAAKRLKLHAREAEENYARDKAFKMKLDALKPLEGE